jgi:hypothetical protein
MRPITVTVPAGAGNSTVIPLDHYISPFNVGVAVTTSDATNLSFVVQQTYANVFASDFNAATATWFTVTTSASNANATGNIAYPVTGVRLSVSGSDAPTTMTVIQAGIAS